MNLFFGCAFLFLTKIWKDSKGSHFSIIEKKGPESQSSANGKISLRVRTNEAQAFQASLSESKKQTHINTLMYMGEVFEELGMFSKNSKHPFWHLNFLSPVWTTTCFIKFSAAANSLPHLPDFNLLNPCHTEEAYNRVLSWNSHHSFFQIFIFNYMSQKFNI